MESRKILVLTKDTPFGESDIREKLRLSVGITAGYKEHTVDFVLMDDAVYLIMLTDETPGISKFVKSFNFNKSRIFVDSDSLTLRNIDPDSVPGPFQLIDREKLGELLKESDLTISL